MLIDIYLLFFNVWKRVCHLTTAIHLVNSQEQPQIFTLQI